MGILRNADFIATSQTATATMKLAKQAKVDAVTQLARDEVQTNLLAELIDTNKLLRDQNRMVWDLLQAQSPKSSATAST